MGRAARSVAEMSEDQSVAFQNKLAFAQGQALVSESEREDGKREADLDTLASAFISSCICVLPVVPDPVSIDVYGT